VGRTYRNANHIQIVGRNRPQVKRLRLQALLRARGDSNQGYWTSQAFVAYLSVTVTVATPDGTGKASFENAQALSGKVADPPRPMPDNYRPRQ
jgi:hypothetical protein